MGTLRTLALGIVKGLIDVVDAVNAERNDESRVARWRLESAEDEVADLRRVVQSLAWSPRFATLGDYHGCGDCGAEFVTPSAWEDVSVSSLLHSELPAAEIRALVERLETLHFADCIALRGTSANTSTRDAVRFEVSP